MRASNLLVPFLLALSLRCACAVLTEYKPIFPPHYYIDAKENDEQAAKLAGLWSGRSAPGEEINLSPGREVYTAGLAALYEAAGRRPLAAKLGNAVMGSMSVSAWQLLSATLVGYEAATLTAVVLALWPTHVFYCSQNLKESLHLLVIALTFLFLAPLPVEEADGVSPRRTAAGSIALFMGGLLRSHLMPLTAGALVLGNLVALRGPAKARRAAALCAILLTMAVFPWSSRKILRRLHSVQSLLEAAYLKDTPPPSLMRPYSPEWISYVRNRRLKADQRAALLHASRTIQTQIFPDAEFKSWWDVAAFVPKGAFYAAFMPLPGLYPVDGNLGRSLASLENLALLALCVAAFAAFLKGPFRPLPLCLAGFFLACLAVFSLFEFDLGSASRHKLLYFPMIFPFAAQALRRLRSR